MSLLDALARHTAPVNLKQLAAETTLHPSTAHRILGVMVESRLVDRIEPGTYRLGIRLLELGNLVKSRISVRQEALPYMQLVNGALQSSNGSSFFAEEAISQSAAGTPQRRYNVAGLDDAMQALAADPEAVSPIFGVEFNPWVEPRELSPQLTV